MTSLSFWIDKGNEEEETVCIEFEVGPNNSLTIANAADHHNVIHTIPYGPKCLEQLIAWVKAQGYSYDGLGLKAMMMIAAFHGADIPKGAVIS